MDPLLALLLGALLGLVVGGAAVWLLKARNQPAEAPAPDLSALVEVQSRASAAEATASALREQLDIQTDHFRERLQTQQLESRERLRQQDDQYTAQIDLQEQRLAELQARIRESQRSEAERREEDGRVLVALSPVAESLQAVQRKVTELEEQRRQQYGELSQQLRSANESEERLRATAESLAAALRSNSTRGVWGETQLRSVVEAAGLLQRVDFDVQSSITTDAGAGRPDMVVHLPGGKSIAVDAKVPFNAFLEASAIPATASESDLARREQLMKAHVKAVRDHITALGSKTYWEGFDSSPEMVIAFIPSESLVSSALEADPSIMEFAFSKRVALSSPVTLWSVLKTVAFSWQQDVLTQDAKVLFDLSRELYTRLTTMATHVDKLGRSIKGTVNDYNKFIGSLERQVLPSARKLNALDESRVLPALEAIEEAPRGASAYELVSALEPDEDAVELPTIRRA
jgi:DNA recombination protein RmuC